MENQSKALCQRLFCRPVVWLMFFILLLQGCGPSPELETWHKEVLDEEFTESMMGKTVNDFNQYLAQEQRLFDQLDQEIYTETRAGPAHSLERFNKGSLSDPTGQDPNWNRTYELVAENPKGAVLLLHGMSDSPYSLRAPGIALHKQGYDVLGLRLPGHGTAPSGLRAVTWQDMSAAMDLAMTHLEKRMGDKPIHIIGYSTGAPLALNYTLGAMEHEQSAIPASLVLVSPAIRVHPTSALAKFKDALSRVPGLERMAYLGIMDEFDPYKYNSFATNAGAQVHGITTSVDQRIRLLSNNPDFSDELPPILVFKSTVDATVTTEAVVDNLLMRLGSKGKNELVLFDIDRHAALESTLLVSDPGPLTMRLLEDDKLPFAVTFVGNANKQDNEVVAWHKDHFSPKDAVIMEPLGLSWPQGVVSLSHVALPFPPDDPLYGKTQPQDDDFIYLGDLAFRGERGLLKIPTDWLLRMRYNPFYEYLESRLLSWVENPPQ